MGLDPAVIASQIRNIRTHAEGERLVRLLRDEREHGASILEALAANTSKSVRFWAAAAAPSILDAASAPLLVQLARDRDRDVSDTAVDELLRIDPEAARVVLPRLRRDLKSNDFQWPVFAMLRLAVLRDIDSLPAINEIAHHPAHPYQAIVAGAAALFLEGRIDEITRRIRSHDHVAMPWLTYLASASGDIDAIQSLRECASSMILDDECRGHCASDLRAMSMTGAK